MRKKSAKSPTVAPRVSPTIECFAAIRQFCSCSFGGVRCKFPLRRLSGKSIGCPIHGIWISEQVDLSTLSGSPEAARALADRRDAQNRMKIRRGEALPHLRIARVQIKESCDDHNN